MSIIVGNADRLWIGVTTMREILFRGKRIDNGEWVEGYYYKAKYCRTDDELCDYITVPHPKEYNEPSSHYIVNPETVGQYTGLTDKNGKKIFEGDIVQYLTYDDFDCKSVVKFGEYKQDGSEGEYNARNCLGFYVEINNFTCPDWCENEPKWFSDYRRQQNILEIANECEVIGNIHNNPELLKGGEEE